MKFYYTLFLSACLFGCTKVVAPVAPTIPTSSRVTIQKPFYTTIDRVLKLELNQSYDKVVSILGSAPYDIYYLTSDGNSVYVWFYKKVERKEQNNLMTSAGGMTTGEQLFVKESQVWVTFKNGRLSNVITTDGQSNASSVLNGVNSISALHNGQAIEAQTNDEQEETQTPQNRPGPNINWR